MSRDTWGPEGPPDEAYSRVTNPERFQSLHKAALELIDRLRAEFDVEMTEGYDLSIFRIGRDRLARPSITLSPNDSACAPITVAFTEFPGIMVRFGKWKEEPLPNCGCDACDEDADEEIEGMTEMFESVIAGGLLEAVRIPRFLGDGWLGLALSGPGMPMTESQRAAKLEMTKMLRGSANASRVFRDGLKESVLTTLGSVSERRVERSTALEMTGGRLYVEYDWKPWPRRQ